MINISFNKIPKIYILWGIIIVSVFFRFWGIWNLDILHDSALNSVRAFGWFDFLAGLGQTSPIIWFGSIPWWALLSFHDHPPGIFAIQYVFLNIFGQGSFGLLFAYALASTATTYFIYKIVKKFSDENSALWSALFFAISSFAVWAARTGYTESVLGFFITLSLLFFTKYATGKQKKDWIWFTVFLALSLVTKYTGIFVVVAAGFYLLIWERDIFRQKFFWLGNVIFTAILSPVIIYNIMAWKTRGHFDAAISSMLGMHPADYAILTRGVSSNFFTNLINTFHNYFVNVSFGFAVVTAISIVWLLMKSFKTQDELKIILSFYLVFLFIMFGFSDTAPRFLAMALPLVAISIGLFTQAIIGKVKTKKLRVVSVTVLLIVLLVFEFFYSLNTNIFYQPAGEANVAYSRYRFPHNGFNKLDRYLKKNVFGKLPPKRTITTLDSSVLNYSLNGREVILVDDRTHWNSQMWYWHRYQVYYDLPIVFLRDAFNSAKAVDKNIFENLLNAGATGFWLVIAQDDSLIKGSWYSEHLDYTEFIDNMIENLEQQGIKPEHIIENEDYGLEFFKIYHFYPN